MKAEEIHRAVAYVRECCREWTTPAVTVVAESGGPFKVLISCIISLRTKDAVTATVSARLFARAATPDSMRRLSVEELQALLYPAGFYRNKALQIKELCERLVAEHGGMVPDAIEVLLRFRGVGRKTANLVLTLGFGKPGICVDTHVHRICNRWGYVTAKTPEETEMRLREILPREYWIEINDLLVAFGQNQCYPVSPRCSTCGLNQICSRVGVRTSR